MIRCEELKVGDYVTYIGGKEGCEDDRMTLDNKYEITGILKSPMRDHYYITLETDTPKYISYVAMDGELIGFIQKYKDSPLWRLMNDISD
jgi:hypothetical protein